MKYNVSKNINIMRKMRDGLEEAFVGKKEIFGSLRDTYIGMYKALTNHDDIADLDCDMHVYSIGNIDGSHHLLLSVDADTIQSEIVKGSCTILSGRIINEANIVILMLTTPMQRHDNFLHIAIEDYLLENTRDDAITNYLHTDYIGSQNPPKWYKVAIITEVIYGYLLAKGICGSNYKGIHGELYDIANAINGKGYCTLSMHMALEGVDVDKAYKEALKEIRLL